MVPTIRHHVNFTRSSICRVGCKFVEGGALRPLREHNSWIWPDSEICETTNTATPAAVHGLQKIFQRQWNTTLGFALVHISLCFGSTFLYHPC